MRRALVLTDETARHPFRARLPIHVRRVAETCVSKRSGHAKTGNAVTPFVAAYATTFAAVLTFIA